MTGIEIWQAVVTDNLKYLTKAPAAIVTLLVSYVIIRIARKLIHTMTTVAKIDRTIQSLILSSVSFVGWVLAIAAVLSVLELHQLSLAVGGSVALVAMALATGLNNVTQDLMAGIFLLSDREFVVGRQVKAGGVEGTLEAISIRKTKIRDANGQIHTVPNRNIDQSTYVIIGDPKGSDQPDKKAS